MTARASGRQSSNNITFTNNEVTGTAGGTNAGGEQGNTLVTIDAQDSTISGNSFTGETARFATAVRARGENTDIENNTFDNSTGGDTRGTFVDNQGEPGSYAGNTFIGGSEADLFQGTPGDDVMSGDANADTFVGGDGDDTVDGGAGNDSIEGGSGSDALTGGDGNDTIDAGKGADVIGGGDGDDVIDGGGNADEITFSAGNDFVDGGNGFDRLILEGTASDYSIAILGLDHFEVTRLSDGSVTEAVNIARLIFESPQGFDAVNDVLSVDAGDVRTLDVLDNDIGTGTVIAASFSGSAEGAIAPASDGLSIEYDLTTGFQSLDAGDSATVDIFYLFSDGATQSDVAEATVTVNGVADDIGAVTDANTDVNEVDEGQPIGANREIIVRATSSDTSVSTQTFSITINDVNDEGVSTPVDDDASPNTVAEGAALDTTVGVTALASDPDALDTVTYTLDDDAGGAFQINATTGVVSVADGTAIDRETDASLDIIVRATSSDTTFETETFTIDVTDVNAFDVTVPVDTSGPSGGEVTENAAAGTPVGIVANAVDQDATNSGVTYSLADNDGGRFVISPSTGEVLAIGSINREDGAVRQITVRATSDDGSFEETTFDIDVADVDEFDVGAPIDADAAANTVDANPNAGDGTGVTAFATDDDATQNGVTYSLVAGDSDFDIDAATGVVTVDAGFDTAGGNTRLITVEALSQDGSTAQADFEISVGGVFNVINGTPNPDTLFGTSDRDIINGLASADALFGEGGDDVLNGDEGNDTLDGGTGADQLVGGTGDDRYVIDNAGDTIVENIGEGTDVVFTSVSIAALAENVENVEIEGAQDLDVTGNMQANFINGNSGANSIQGLGGEDDIRAGAGDDVIDGGGDSDVIKGEAGNDVITGGEGRNVIFGGSGADTFVFSVVPTDSSNNDRIRDFDSTEGDSLRLDSSVFTAFGGALSSDNLTFGRSASDADDFLIFDDRGGRIFYDADGNGSGAQVMIARLDGITNADISISDFEII